MLDAQVQRVQTLRVAGWAAQPQHSSTQLRAGDAVRLAAWVCRHTHIVYTGVLVRTKATLANATASDG